MSSFSQNQHPSLFPVGSSIYRARQLIIEPPQISPINAPLGAVIKYALTTETTSLMEVRLLVDWQIKNRLLAVLGVTQVVIFGGDQRQYQVLIDPNKLKQFKVSLNEVTEAVKKANSNAPGGFLISPDQELLIRGIGRIESLQGLEQSVITARRNVPIFLSQVADIKIGAALKRGDASLNGQSAIILIVNKQPAADTPTVTKAVEDLGRKKEIYQRTFKTRNYFVYDPFNSASLRGWKLQEDKYEVIIPNEHGWLWSNVLNLWLGTWLGVLLREEANWLRFYTPDSHLVLLSEEAAEQELQTTQERLDLLAAKLRELGIDSNTI